MTDASVAPPTSAAALRHALAQVARGATLEESEAGDAFGAIMTGEMPATLVAGLLVGLRARGESPAEVAGAVRALRNAMHRVAHPAPDTLVDTCGTGGGTVSTLNISTAAAFVAAGAGVPIAKHGNRSFTSQCGSADVLEALGIGIDLDPARAAEVLQRAGIVFLFAPSYHPAMRHVGPIRRELGVPTIMNLVGPLANPAGAMRQVIGVSEKARGPLLAQALVRLRVEHAMVVHAEIGMDELSTVGLTHVWEVKDKAVREWQLDPARHGLATESLDGIAGGNRASNAERIQQLLEVPAAAPEVLRNIVILNAAAAIHVSAAAPMMDVAVRMARESLDGGSAARALASLRAASPA